MQEAHSQNGSIGDFMLRLGDCVCRQGPALFAICVQQWHWRVKWAAGRSCAQEMKTAGEKQPSKGINLPTHRKMSCAQSSEALVPRYSSFQILPLDGHYNTESMPAIVIVIW